ncbi:MAG: response regulator, partial [Kofleriaceae bacterium]|nr:response regulator [Kofleriaceae bacterium]
MSGPSKVIVLDPDPQAGRQIQLGLSREGVPTHIPVVPSEPSQLADLASEVPGLVLIGGVDGQAVELVRRARELLGPDVPIVSTARGAARADLEAAGADEVVARPSYLRDLVTLCRILRGVPAGKRDHLVGSLVETTGVYTLVRALSSLGRSAVLTLIRGLRRGEVRFYRGEVTSAEVGLIHGQAALHQLLLWTDARFDFAHEDIVRRQQIPLTPDELFADAERFLQGVREHAGPLSPATVLEQDTQRILFLGKQVPTEVHGVLRMFDGHRVLADILEDSPYRVFETLRVAQKAVEVGLLKAVDAQRPKATWRAVLAIDEWLVGETREAVVERTSEIDSGPVSTTAKRKGKGKSRKRSKAATPPAGIRAEIDWGALVPRNIGAEVGPLSGVVPAQAAAGEVTIATRDRQREKLEALMDTDKRDRIFPTEIGLEPKVVIADDAAPTAKVVVSSEGETSSGKKKKQKKTGKSGPVSKVTPLPGALDEAAARAKAEADASEQRAKEIAEQNAREAEAEAREAQVKAREAQAQAKEAAALAEQIAREA